MSTVAYTLSCDDPLLLVRQYHPKITLLRSTNAGKSLLSKKAFEETVDMATFATEDGIVGDGLEEWLSGVLKK